MQVTINSQPYNVPFLLSQITLNQYLEFYEKYGFELSKEANEIETRDYEQYLKNKGFTTVSVDDITLHKQLHMDDYLDNEALSWYQFWTGMNFFEVRDEPFIVPVLVQYRQLSPMLKDGNELIKSFISDIEYNDELWSIQHYTNRQPPEISFNERSLSREVLKAIYSLNQGNWSVLPYLCCVFFRKKDEPFSPLLLQEERMNLIKQMPMNYAMSIVMLLRDALNATGLNLIEIDVVLLTSLIRQALLN